MERTLRSALSALTSSPRTSQALRPRLMPLETVSSSAEAMPCKRSALSPSSTSCRSTADLRGESRRHHRGQEHELAEQLVVAAEVGLRFLGKLQALRRGDLGARGGAFRRWTALST